MVEVKTSTRFKKLNLTHLPSFYDLSQVMVLPRSGMLRSLRVTLVETSSTLLLPDTPYDILQVLVPLLYGSKMTISVEAYSALSSVCAALDFHDWLQQEETEEENKVEE